MSDLFSAVFLAMLALTTMLRVFLSLRQMRHVAAHRAAVVENFKRKRLALGVAQRAVAVFPAGLF